MKNKELQKLIREGRREIREGKFVSWEEVKRNLRDLAIEKGKVYRSPGSAKKHIEQL